LALGDAFFEILRQCAEKFKFVSNQILPGVTENLPGPLLEGVL